MIDDKEFNIYLELENEKFLDEFMAEYDIKVIYENDGYHRHTMFWKYGFIDVLFPDRNDLYYAKIASVLFCYLWMKKVDTGLAIEIACVYAKELKQLKYMKENKE